MAADPVPIRKGLLKTWWDEIFPALDSGIYSFSEQLVMGSRIDDIRIKSRAGLLTGFLTVLWEFRVTASGGDITGDGAIVVDEIIDDWDYKEEGGDALGVDLGAADVNPINSIVGKKTTESFTSITSGNYEDYAIPLYLPVMTNRDLLFSIEMDDTPIEDHYSGAGTPIVSKKLIKFIPGYINPAGETRKFAFVKKSFPGSQSRNELRFDRNRGNIFGVFLYKPPGSGVIDDVRITDSSTPVIDLNKSTAGIFYEESNSIYRYGHRSIPGVNYDANVKLIDAADSLNYLLCYDLGILTAGITAPPIPGALPESSNPLEGNAVISQQYQPPVKPEVAGASSVGNLWQQFLAQVQQRYPMMYQAYVQMASQMIAANQPPPSVASIASTSQVQQPQISGIQRFTNAGAASGRRAARRAAVAYR